MFVWLLRWELILNVIHLVQMFCWGILNPLQSINFQLLCTHSMVHHRYLQHITIPSIHPVADEQTDRQAHQNNGPDNSVIYCPGNEGFKSWPGRTRLHSTQDMLTIQIMWLVLEFVIVMNISMASEDHIRMFYVRADTLKPTMLMPLDVTRRTCVWVPFCQSVTTVDVLKITCKRIPRLITN